jgi:transcriptional antiterminator RfaH
MSEKADPDKELHWYCVRSQPKHEHIAAAQLRQLENVEVFCPRLRFKRTTRRGLVWAIEALFPNYLFARFVMYDSKSAVMYGRGVSTILRFGGKHPVIADHVIQSLRELMANEEMRVVERELKTGDNVQIVSGPFQGQEGVVHRMVPGRERVRILLEVLGGTREAEVELKALFKPGTPAMIIAG